uniref:Arsenite methyltransferase n=1 Tax=Bicosoecida sp. CB-2014 TaxID=1486930 RepID=A0A7S1G4P4_9STRA
MFSAVANTVVGGAGATAARGVLAVTRRLGGTALPTRLAVRCASNAAAAPSLHGLLGDDADVTVASVKEYYGKVLKASSDLKTSACTSIAAPAPMVAEALKKVPKGVSERFYGCGVPLPLGIDGLHVLDLGSGSGRDCYVAAALVGPSGSVTGIDMTAEQLDVARAHVDEYAETLGWRPNLKFVEGQIEHIADAGVADGSVDLVISNCVVNLSPAKDAVLRGAYNALRDGGEMYFSDVYASRRLPREAVQHEVLWGECLAGALYTGDFVRLCRDVGFTDPRVLSTEKIEVTDPELADVCGEAQFYSITYRLFKLPAGVLETECEDYGQVAVYNGGIPGHRHRYELDDHHVFEAGRPMLVCGNTASMVGETWLSPYFTVHGDRSTHFGLFDCGPAPGSAAPSAASASAGACDVGGSVLGGGSCC